MAGSDQLALEKHYRKHRKGFVAKVRRSLDEYAEDVVQEAYKRALVAINKADGYEIQNLHAWMNRILFTVSQDYEKFAKGMGFQQVEDEPIEDDNHKRVVRDEILSSIKKIPNAVERDVITMNFLYGYDRMEISQILDVNIRTVEFWLAKFRANVRDVYAAQI